MGSIHPGFLRIGTLLACLVAAFGCDGKTSGSSTGAEIPDTSKSESGPVVVKPADPAAGAGLAAVCVQTINNYRATLGLAKLAEWTDSAACFSRQATLDDQANKGHANFGMCKEAAQNTCPNWLADQAVGGVQGAMERCIESMWNEGPGEDYSKHGHYINMTNKSYTKVGCGFHLQSGSVWINMDFK
ncbi:MAG: hypothetical protein IPO40_05445 [Fibrobacteres bacterium]|nr:hypothetical protein [Fibrobacterota bacterium]